MNVAEGRVAAAYFGHTSDVTQKGDSEIVRDKKKKKLAKLDQAE